ncbi:MAG TPA: peptidoglycan-binding protein [Candidatus Humimicrobiaceae bacterium]|nr:peptidoglycan-binding protein [Candidatus Humimicrobiaceae bacterium]
MKKIIFVISFIVLSSFLFGFSVSEAKAATVEELLAQIQQLQAQITALQQQLAQIQGEQPVTWCHTFNVNLKIGDTGSEVTALQAALSKEGLYTREITGKFDEYTASAVVAFQEKYASEVLVPWGLAHGTGYVASTTRAKLNKLYGCGIVKPYIQILSPNGGEVFVQGQSSIIRWKGGQPTQPLEPGKGPVAIALFDEAGEKQIGSIYSIAWPDSSYTWDAKRVCAGFNYEVGINCFDISPGRYRIWVGIRDGSAKDLSDAAFSIISATTSTCTDSDGGKNYYVRGTAYDKGYYTSGGQDSCFSHFQYDHPVLNEYYCESGVVESETYDCLYGCKDGACVSATTTPSITVLSPNGGEQWVQGNTYDITWTSSGVEKIYMNLVYSNGASAWVAGGIEASLGKYAWTISSNIPTGDRLKIIITAEEQVSFPALQDESDNYFTIVSRTLTCTDSDGGKDYYVKGTVTYGSTVNTDTCSASGYLFEQYCLNGNPVQGTYWCPNDCKDGACVSATTTPSIAVVSPNGGEAWESGKTYDIRWQSQGVDRIAILIADYTYSSEIIKPIIEDISAATGRYTWTIPNDFFPTFNSQWKSGDDFKIYIAEIKETIVDPYGRTGYTYGAQDRSDNYFSIVAATTTPPEEILVPGYNFYVKTSDTGTGNWSSAKSSCEALGSGWSLPTMAQLRILYQKKNEIGGFKSQAYWSSESGKYIHFSNGFESSMNPAMTFPAFRCVKETGGMGLEFIEDQLASLSNTLSRLIEQMRDFIGR